MVVYTGGDQVILTQKDFPKSPCAWDVHPLGLLHIDYKVEHTPSSESLLPPGCKPHVAYDGVCAVSLVAW